MSQEGLGRVVNVIANASGVHIPLTRGEAVTFVSYLAAGTQALTLQESLSGASATNLAVIDKVYKGPGAGGTWSKVTQAASNAFTNADATNNTVVLTVRARQLTPGKNSVALTAGTGTVCAIVHDLNHQSAPEKLASNIVA